MEFSSSPQTSKAVSIFFGTVSFVFFYFTFFVAEGFGRAILLIITLLSAYACYAALTSSYCVKFDSDRMHVHKRFKAGLFTHESAYPIKDYNSVGIGIGGRGGNPASTVAYFIQLLGQNNLKVSISSVNCENVIAEAETLAEYLELPLDKTPRTVFFGKRV